MISAIIITHNRSGLIGRAISSVRKQSLPVSEIIVVDDASTDGTTETVNALAGNDLKYIRMQEHGGGNAARNRGVLAAHGEFLAFLDDDDAWRPNKIARQSETLQSTDAILCYTGIQVNHEHSKRTEYVFNRPRWHDQHKSVMNENFIGTTSSVITRRQAIIDAGLFDEHLPAFQDYDLYIRLLRKGHTVGLDEPLIDYQVAHNQGKITLDPARNLKAARIILAKYHAERHFILLQRAMIFIFIRRSLKSATFMHKTIRCLLSPLQTGT